MEQSALIEKVLALTGEIEHAAALADWPEAARLAELRSPLIMSLDAQQVQGSLDVGRGRRLDHREVAGREHRRARMTTIRGSPEHVLGPSGAASSRHASSTIRPMRRATLFPRSART